MTTPTVAPQITAAGTALALLTAHPDLPAAHVEFRTLPQRGILTWGLRISIHDSISDFEPWRETLAIDPEAVDGGRLRGTAWIEGIGEFAGAPVELVAYYTPPTVPDETDGQ